MIDRSLLSDDTNRRIDEYNLKPFGKSPYQVIKEELKEFNKMTDELISFVKGNKEWTNYQYLI